ncbi:MAG: 16S rRNA processing protein RimM [Bacteroidetes bacterium HGW-Bacteroidetes-8]|jgi:16S rRNA processing protein RimM|nr:MAG: 16S rRNA processing protein RimM [Bacteroidetes bacterium HGW-Bacteroidetes-8]
MSAPANSLLPVAKVIKSFGVKGEMLIRYSPHFQEEIDEKRPVFIAYDGLPVPFFIESLTNRGTDQALVKLSGINSDDLVNEISGEIIFIEQKGQKAKEKSFSAADITGYTVLNLQGDIIGTVAQYYDYPGNPCFGITREDKERGELLLPVHEDIIKKITPGKKVLVAQIPEGLLDI